MNRIKDLLFLRFVQLVFVWTVLALGSKINI